MQLLFAGAAGALVGRAVSAGVEGALLPPPTGFPRAPRPAPAPVRPRPLDGAALARLTGLAPAPAAGEDGPAAPPPTGPVRSSLPVRLLGTLVDEARAEWSAASLQDTTTRQAGTYLLHDFILGAEVVAIERTRVVVEVHGRREYLDGRGAEPVALTRAVPAAAVLRQVGPGAYELPRAELERWMERLDEVVVQGRWTPVVREGRVAGFRLSGLRPGALFSQLGLQEGDVLQRVNGRDLGSAGGLLELPALLTQAVQVELEVGRGGATVRQRYTLR